MRRESADADRERAERESPAPARHDRSTPPRGLGPALERILSDDLGGGEAAVRRLLGILVESSAGVDSAVALRREGGGPLRAWAWSGFDGGAPAAAPAIPLAAAVLDTRRPALVRGAEVEAGLAPAGTRVVYAVPLLAGGEPLGLLAIASRSAHDFSRGERLLARIAAQRAASAAARADTAARERALRSAAEEAEHRWSFLAEAGVLLARSLEYETTLASLARLVVSSLADWCTVHLVNDDGSIDRVAIAHVDPSKEALVTAYQARIPERLRVSIGVPAVIRTGRPTFAPDIPADLLRQAADDPIFREVIGRLAPKSFMIVPLRARERSVGAVVFVSSTRRYTPGDLALAEDLARRAALAVESARLYRALQESEERGRLLLEAAPEAILGTDREGRCDFVNPSALRLLGYDGPGEVVGKNLHDLLHSRRPDGSPFPAAECSCLDAIRQGRSVHADEALFWRADGTSFHAQFWVNALQRRGRVAGAVVTLVDVTERKRAEEAARQTASFRDQMIGIVGHDLRNPLGAIVMSAALLQKKGGLDGWQARTIDRVRSSAGRMGRIINDILGYTRTRLGSGIPIDPRPTDLREVCRKVVDELTAMNPDRSILSRAEGETVGVWDPDRLEQVMSNLLSNALDHGDPQAPVEVDIRGDAEAVRITVRNTGDPIPPEMLAKAFEPFHRRPDHEGRRTAGLGLGLYIAHLIVQSHGGEIGMTSTADDGTEVWARLPRRTASADVDDAATTG
jgi:PAS domain S-box-containing protein